MALLVPELLQTKKYRARSWRAYISDLGGLQAGVYNPTDAKVTQRSAGANLSVDAAAGTIVCPANDPGNAGLYRVVNDATVNVPLTTGPHATLPRIDQLVVTVNDSIDGADASDTPVLAWITGTPTSGATLDNRSGAVAAIPFGSVRLADVLVPANTATIPTANIRDRRPWARGAQTIVYNASPGGVTTSPVLLGALTHRVEFSGAPIRATFNTLATPSVATAILYYGITLNGVFLKPSGNAVTLPIAAQQGVLDTVFGTPTAGSAVASVQAYANTGAINFFQSQLVVEEILRGNATNG